MLRELGARTYEANCQNCHGARGRGWDQYPPLTGMAELFAAPRGRAYVIRLHLVGLASDRWRAPMPPMGHMHDVALAAAINHTLTSFGNQLPPGVQPVTPAEIAAQRGTRLRPTQVAELRP